MGQTSSFDQVTIEGKKNANSLAATKRSRALGKAVRAPSRHCEPAGINPRGGGGGGAQGKLSPNQPSLLFSGVDTQSST